MIDYTNLIARLETAEGPSRELDYQIQRLVFSPMTNGNPVREFTRSLDAAVSLVPEGYRWSIESSEKGLLSPVRPTASVGVDDPNAPNGDMYFAPTPVLALCIAALKARQAEND